MALPWFKHFNNSDSSLSIQKLMDEHGVAGYAYYYLFTELCHSKGIAQNDIYTLSSREVGLKLRIKSGRVQVILKSFLESSLIQEYSGEVIIKIKFPKLRELQDKHSKYSRKRVARKSQDTTLDRDKDIDIDIDKDNTPLPPKGVGELKLEDVVNIWNASCHKYGLSEIKGINEKRRKQFKIASKDITTLDDWRYVLTAAVDRSFTRDGRTWKPTIDYILRTGMPLQLLEEYTNNQTGINLDEI